MRTETKVNKINRELEAIDSCMKDLESRRIELLNELYYAQTPGFVKLSTKGKKIKNHR